MRFFQFSRNKADSRQQAPSLSDPIDERSPSPIAIIYRSEIDYISRCILDYPRIETGGQLFGFWTTEGVPVVLYAIGPGRDANHQLDFFNQDIPYLKLVGNRLISKYGLQHIGEWHSHHRLGLAHPSGHDAHTMFSGMRKTGMRRVLLCIGNCNDFSSTLNAFTFHEESPADYRHAAWEIKELESPFRPIIDRELAADLQHPRTERPSHGELYLARHEVRTTTEAPTYTADHWLKNKENNLVLKEIMDFLKMRAPEAELKVQMDERKVVYLTLQQGEESTRVVFPEGFPTVAPVIECSTPVRGKQGGAAWYSTGNIYYDFTNYFMDYTMPATEPKPEAPVPPSETAAEDFTMPDIFTCKLPSVDGSNNDDI